MKWSVRFFNASVMEETLGFPTGIRANFLHIMEMVGEMGPNLGKPYTEGLGDGLFEIRARGKEGIGRSFFCYAQRENRTIVILHSFIKKSQKTPKKELLTARQRKKEYDDAHAKP